MVQIVKEPTRIDPVTGIEVMLDPIIMTMSQFYQEPICLKPLDPDSDKIGKQSDHKIPIVKPINIIDNRSSREIRTIKTYTR